MFLTTEQVEQLQELCEKVAGSYSRTGKVIINIYNNMPRTFDVELPVYNEDHVKIGATTVYYRCSLPEEEIEKHRQSNRLKPKRRNHGD